MGSNDPFFIARVIGSKVKIVDQFDPQDPVKTLMKIADIVKMVDALNMPPEEEHLIRQ